MGDSRKYPYHTIPGARGVIWTGIPNAREGDYKARKSGGIVGSLSFEIADGGELVLLQSTVCNKTNIFMICKKISNKTGQTGNAIQIQLSGYSLSSGLINETLVANRLNL